MSVANHTTPAPFTLNLDGLLPVERVLETPFCVIVDSQEKQPFTFQHFHADAAHHHRRLSVRWRWESLGPGGGDYSIEGFRGVIAIERKSLEDAQSTFCSYAERRRRWEEELANLSTYQFAVVVIEATLETVLREMPQWGVKSAAENRNTLFHSVQAWQQRFPSVQWCWCDSRELAERWTFRHLERFWNWKQRELRRKQRQAKRERKALKCLTR